MSIVPCARAALGNRSFEATPKLPETVASSDPETMTLASPEI